MLLIMCADSLSEKREVQILNAKIEKQKSNSLV